MQSSFVVRFPRHLWTGDWRLDADASRAAAEEAAARHREALRRAALEREAAVPPPAPRRGRTLLVTALALAVAAIAAAFTVGLLVSPRSDNTKPLPAVAENPIQPKGGRSVAGSVYAAASPAVVSVKTSAGSGTGFLIGSDGKLVTNAHVVNGNSRVVVRFGPDGNSLDAAVIGTDVSSDLAVLQHRPRQRAAGREAAPVRRLAQRADRRSGDRDRQPVRARPRPRPRASSPDSAATSRRPTASRSTR